MSSVSSWLATLSLVAIGFSSVAERRHEFGIRMALGAESSKVLRHVLGQGLVLSLVGIGIR